MSTQIEDQPEVRNPSLLPAILSLFTSSATLICCALPALLVSLGMGAVMAGLIETIPQITWLGKHKVAVFSVAAVVLAGAGWMQWRARNAPCPADPAKARACTFLRRTSWVLWWIAVVAYVVGFFFAFLAADLLA